MAGERDGLYFWRTRGGLEVDFVVYAENRFWAIEVKNSSRIHPADMKGLHAFHEDYPEATPMLLYRGRERIVQNGITLIPVEEFLPTL